MATENRSIALCIVLSIVTCGIYGLYWYYCILSDLYALNGMENSAAMDLVLSIITCGIYAWYVLYKMGGLLKEAKERNGVTASDNSVMFLVLGLFGLGIIVYCIVQNELNELSEHVRSSGFGGDDSQYRN